MADKQPEGVNDPTLPSGLTISRDGSTSPEVIEAYKELNSIDERDAAIPHATIHHPEPDHNVRARTNEYIAQEETLDAEMLEREQALEEEDEEADANEARLMEELRRTTENNRHIPSLTALKTMLPAKKKQPKLDFDEPVIKTLPDRVIIQHIYGRHHEDDPAASVTKLRKTHAYLIACDFSSESMSAIEWTMGTMMRDGDEAHLVVAVNGEEMHPSGRGRSPTKELENIAVALADKSKAILRHMLLYDIKLVAHAVRGRIKDVLMTMIEQMALTMVVCGSRGRSTMQGLLMGSISTYLIQKSPVPVSVIRYQKKRTKSHSAKQAHAQSLSESVKTGQLVVDELSGIAKGK